MLYLVVVSPIRKEKKRKRNINNDLAILPSHNISAAVQTVIEREQSNLIDNTTYCHTNYCKKGA